jgi:hypothetical protein
MRHRPETELDRAGRHVREGEALVARQAALVAEMALLGQVVQAALGRRLLENMRASLVLQKHHLRAIETRVKR